MVISSEFGSGIIRYTIREGRYSASILSRGATLQSFCIDDTDIVLGYEDSNGYLSNDNYFGQVVGPFANRIKCARYFDDLGLHVLEKNDGNNSLHSGSKNYGYQAWELADQGSDYVSLTYHSPVSGGFPSSEDVKVTYRLNESGELTIFYKVKVDKRCPVNITNHAFFNLNGDGSDIRSHELYLPSGQYLEVDDELIPTQVTASEGTPFDFTTRRPIGLRRNGAYDHCFVLDKVGITSVENDKLRLSMKTDLPAVQLYTGQFIKSCVSGKKGVNYGAFSGFCLETECYPDYPNRHDFRDRWVRAGETTVTTTTFKLERK